MNNNSLSLLKSRMETMTIEFNKKITQVIIPIASANTGFDSIFPVLLISFPVTLASIIYPLSSGMSLIQT